MAPIRYPLLTALLASQVTGGALAAAEEYNFTVHLPSPRPAWAEKLSPHLAGFSHRWTDWAGPEVGKPNEYFNQLLRNLAERTGHMPFIRVEANSQERATVDLGLQVMNKTFPEPTGETPNPEADRILIGRDFYALSGNLPVGTPFIRANATTCEVHLLNIELGNEPDFYGPTRNGRPGAFEPEWNILNYTDTWARYAAAVSKEIELGSPGSGKPTLSPGAFTGFNAPEWTPAGSLQAGILDSPRIRRSTAQFTEHVTLPPSTPGTWSGPES